MRVGSRLACPRALCHTCGRTARPPRSCSRSVGKICRAWTRSRLSSLFAASPQSNPRRPPLDPECGPDLDTTRHSCIDTTCRTHLDATRRPLRVLPTLLPSRQNCSCLRRACYRQPSPYYSSPCCLSPNCVERDAE